jgi:hypothetical protein
MVHKSVLLNALVLFALVLSLAPVPALAGPVPAPVLQAGSGDPVLVIGTAADPFSWYHAEILRAEGLNAFGMTTSRMCRRRRWPGMTW